MPGEGGESIMLTVEVRVNGRLVASAKLVNQTHLAAILGQKVERMEGKG